MKFVSSCKKKRKKKNLRSRSLNSKSSAYIESFQLLGRCLIFSRVHFVFLRTNISYTVAPLCFLHYIPRHLSLYPFFQRNQRFIGLVSPSSLFLSLPLPYSLFPLCTLLSLSLHVPLLPFFPSNLGQAPFNSSIHVYFDYIIEIIFKFIKFSRDV